MQRHRNYYDRGVSGSNRVYVLLLILIGILTAAFFIGGYRRANGNIDEYGNEITEGTSSENVSAEGTTVDTSNVEAVAEKFYNQFCVCWGFYYGWICRLCFI